jgi:hypothetical protein
MRGPDDQTIKCDECQAPAIGGSADLEETEPVKDDAGYLWRTWKNVGWHLFCEDHRQDPTVLSRKMKAEGKPAIACPPEALGFGMPA